MVVDSVCRFRNFEQLHRNLRDLHQYNLQLPPKRILSSSLDDAFVRERCILLDKYLKVSLAFSAVNIEKICVRHCIIGGSFFST